MATAWPPGLYPRNISFEIENVSRSGGVSTNGMEQVVGSGVGRWTASYSEVPVADDDAILAWRAFKAGLRGRAGTILLPAIDWRRAPWPVDAYGRTLSPVNVRRDSLDGTQFADPAIPAKSAIIATVTTTAALRATTIAITVSQGAAPRPGHYFSIGNRLHLITETIGTGTYRIEPPLRAAASAGTVVNFSTPACEMRLVDDGQGSLDLEMGRWGFVSLSFVEAI